jgi:hypothetical protein
MLIERKDFLISSDHCSGSHKSGLASIYTWRSPEEADGRAGFQDALEVAREARDIRRGDPRCPGLLLMLALTTSGQTSTVRSLARSLPR